MSPDTIKSCTAVKKILDNLAGSDFTLKHGSKAVEGLKEYAPDMTIDVYKEMVSSDVTDPIREDILKFWEEQRT